MVAAPTIRPGERGLVRAVAIVPARLGSTRLPRKMLLRETGRFLFEHTVLNARAAGVFERVVLATDSAEVRDAADAAGIEAVMTAATHASGTDRVHEAYEELAAGGPWEVVVNVQGDEPELPREGLRRLLAAFADDDVSLATLTSALDDEAAFRDPNVVKVVVDAHGDALYFSRAPIPLRREPGREPLHGPLRHVGVYAFRPPALRAFCALPPGRLERTEGLEQLRWLEAGRRIRCVLTSVHPSGIDTAEQYASFRARVRDRVAPDPAVEGGRNDQGVHPS